jgi:DNA topoisomerase-2
VTGGRNGYGAKLANIFSTQFTVDVADGQRGRRYTQVFSNNMMSKAEPKIEPYKGPDFTCISFKPDLARFKMTSLDADTAALLCRRVYDMAGVLGRSVAVMLNGDRVPVTSFADYVGLYRISDKGEELPKVWERVNDRWEVCFTLSDGAFSQVSFVNSISTTKGGQHVSYIADQIANAIAESVNKKNKGVDVKPIHVRNYMTLFVNCSIENPAFDSQTKDTLTTRVKDFGSTADLSEKFIKQGA